MAEHVPDNYDFFRIHDETLRAEREAIEKRLPICAECGNPIWDDECFFVDGDYICENCMNEKKVWVQNHMKEE